MKKGMHKVDWRENYAGRTASKLYKKGEREKEAEVLMKKIAPVQTEYRSAAAKAGERMSPTWMPDDIKTKNFDEKTSTAYLRKIY